MQELNSPHGGGETPLGSHSNKSGRPTDGVKSPTTDKSTRRLLTDMDKTKKKLLEKGLIQPSEIDEPIREIKINPVFMNKAMVF